MNKEQFGPWAVVTGASRGIGLGYARELAKKGFHLVLLARNGAKLEEISENLKNAHNVQVKWFSVDLLNLNQITQVLHQIEDLPIGLAVLNAGFGGKAGAFVDSDPESLSSMIGLNVDSTTRLAHYFSKRFKEQSRGGIIFLSSLAGLFPAPPMSVYGATKSYVYQLGMAIGIELAPHGVEVIVLAPGGVDTDMPLEMGFDPAKLPGKPTPVQTVVDQSLSALGRKRLLIPGFGNWILAFVMMRLLPASVSAKLWAHFSAKGMADNQ